MKKLFTLILGVLFMIPLTVKADMGAPMISEYKATPASTDGATIYDSAYKENPKVDGKFEYNDILSVNEEIKSGDKVYVYGCNKNNKCGYVLISELKLSSASENFKDYELLYKGHVFSKKDLKLYKRPGYIYEKTGETIPAGADVKVSSFESDLGTWVRVQYKDKVGYVDSSDAAVMILYNGEALDVENNKSVNEFYLSNAYDRRIAFKVNGEYKITYYEGAFRVWSYPTSEFELLKDVKLYKQFHFTDEYEIGSLSKGDKVKILFDCSDQGEATFYVESSEKKGWVTWDTVYNSSYLKGYDNEKVNDYYLENPSMSNVPVAYTDDEPSSGDAIGPEEDKDVIVPDKEEDDDFFAGFTKGQIILISSIGAGVIVLTAIVTIILVNKKNKKKKDTSKKEEDRKDESVQE